VPLNSYRPPSPPASARAAGPGSEPPPVRTGTRRLASAALEPTGLTARQRHDAAILVLSLVRNLTQEALDSDEQGDEEWTRLTTHQLTVYADRFPALTRAVAEGAFSPTDDDPLAFGLTCVLDGIQGLVESATRA
jgi:hypothetical protein